jgi:N-acetylglucosamine kinase-like BadF-type ATPase
VPHIVVGVDAGGSGTLAAIARGDEPPRTYAGEAANPNVCGVDGTVRVIARLLAEALAGDEPNAIVVGAAGAGRPTIAQAMAHGLRSAFPAAHVAVTHDAHIALRAAVPHGDGIVLIAGTGAVAYGDVGGKQVRAGGGGYALGDEGSGYAVGAAALRLLQRRFEGRVSNDALLEALAAHAKATNATELAAFVYAEAPIATVAAVAPIVLQSADAGERSATKIVQAAALELFELVRAVCRGTDAGASELPLAFSGGLLQKNGLLTYLLETRIAAEFPYLRVVKGGGEPHLGALAQARELLKNGSLT